MRTNSTLFSTFWTGDTAKALRERGRDHLLLANYLITGPLNHYFGLYFAPRVLIAEHTGIELVLLDALWHGLREEGFAEYDTKTEWVWVREAVRFNLGDEPKPKDNRLLGAPRWYAALPNVPHLGPFHDRWGQYLGLGARRELKAKPAMAAIPMPALNAATSSPRRMLHPAHAYCGERLCLPTFLADEFMGLLGTRGGEREDLIEWAERLDRRMADADVPITSDVLGFWRREFADLLKSRFVDDRVARRRVR